MCCGLYEVTGVVRTTAHGYELRVAEGSVSETRFTPLRRDEPKLFPYVDLSVKSVLKVLDRFDGNHAKIESIQSIALRLPDPLRAMDSKFTLTQEMDCRK